MWFRWVLLVLLSSCLTSVSSRYWPDHGRGHSPEDKKVEEILNRSEEQVEISNSTEQEKSGESDIGSLPVIISNPWVRTEKLEGFGNLTWTAKSVVPRLFADMGRAGFPPVESVMKWSCWNDVDEKAKEQFIEIFNENNTKRVLKTKLDQWINEYNGTEISDKIRRDRDDFNDRMKLFSINFESALSTLSTAVRTFNDVALDDGMTIGQSNALLNNIADILDKNFMKSLNHLFNGNVMNGKKLQKIIAKAVTTTSRPHRMTFPPHWGNATGNDTGNGVWHGNWKRYTVVRRVTNRPAEIVKAV